MANLILVKNSWPMKNIKDMVQIPPINSIQIELVIIISGAMLVAMAMATLMVMVVSRF